MTGRQRAIGLAGAAFLLQGAWAHFINAQHDGIEAARAALLHGGSCFVLTLVSASFMESVFGRVRRSRFRAPVTVTVTAVLMVGGTFIVHLVQGTPAPASTCALLLAVGVPYYVVYTSILCRAAQRSDRTAQGVDDELA